jgi:membrane associated rhomboid family serine protease
MIPISDSVRSRTFPYVNVAIIVANVAVFLYQVWLSGDTIIVNARGEYTELDRFVEHWANVPACTLDALGWNQANAADAICRNQPETLLTPITSVFMHGGWLHLLGNMLFLWIFGDNVEDTMGHLRYGIFYMLMGVLAGFAHSAVDASSTTPSLGASGSIAGVMAAYLVLFPRANVTVIFGFFLIPIPIPAFVLIGFWFLTELFSGVASLDVERASGGIAYFAHIGGFVAGAVLVHLFVLGRPRPKEKRSKAMQFW